MIAFDVSEGWVLRYSRYGPNLQILSRLRGGLAVGSEPGTRTYVGAAL